MTQTEKDIMKDAFYYLKDHADPPKGQAASEAFWAKAAADLAEAGQKWEHHPLAVEVLTAVYLYIEQKQKELSK